MDEESEDEKSEDSGREKDRTPVFLAMAEGGVHGVSILFQTTGFLTFRQMRRFSAGKLTHPSPFC
jgi:hypothetical protein